MDAYERACRRVARSKQLTPFKAFILAEWPEGDRHYAWVAAAPVREILEWINQTRDHRAP